MYLHSKDSTPTRDVDRLHVRDNLQMAIEADSDKGNTLLRVAGKGLKSTKQVASKTAEVLNEKTIKYTEDAWKLAEKHMETAMQHWRTKMGEEWLKQVKQSNDGSASAAAAARRANQERPIVLRKRRQRIKAKVNWSLFYYMFNQDHAQPDLIWNFKTRQELNDALEGEIASFLQDRELSAGSIMSWNYNEFEVNYNSLVDEIKIGDYFLRLLLEEDQADNMESPINKSGEFFNDLYHRFLLTPKTEMKCLCLRAMTIVYGRHYEEIGAFNDTKYIVAMLERVSLVCTFSKTFNI
jgi:DnaJ family protein C protein 13